jgi:hypothetical protein
MAKKRIITKKSAQSKIKFNPSDIRAMLCLRARGMTLAAIGKKFGVSASRVCTLLRRAKSSEAEPTTPMVTHEMKQAVQLFVSFAKKWGWRSDEILRLITVALVAEISGSPQSLKLGQLVTLISDPEKVALFRKLRRELLDSEIGQRCRGTSCRRWPSRPDKAYWASHRLTCRSPLTCASRSSQTKVSVLFWWLSGSWKLSHPLVHFCTVAADAATADRGPSTATKSILFIEPSDYTK